MEGEAFPERTNKLSEQGIPNILQQAETLTKEKQDRERERLKTKKRIHEKTKRIKKKVEEAMTNSTPTTPSSFGTPSIGGATGKTTLEVLQESANKKAERRQQNTAMYSTHMTELRKKMAHDERKDDEDHQALIKCAYEIPFRMTGMFPNL